MIAQDESIVASPKEKRTNEETDDLDARRDAGFRNHRRFRPGEGWRHQDREESRQEKGRQKEERRRHQERRRKLSQIPLVVAGTPPSAGPPARPSSSLRSPLHGI